MRLPRRRRLEAALLVAAFALLARPPGALAGPPPFTASGQPFQLAASSLTTTGLTYAGNVTVGGTPAMDLQFTGLSMDDFRQVVPCHASGTLQVVDVTEATSATAGGTFEVWATRLSYVGSGPVLEFTPASPPAAGILTGTALSLQVDAVAAVAPSLHLNGSTTYTAFCS